LQALILARAVAGKGYEELKTEVERIASETNVPFDRVRETVLQPANEKGPGRVDSGQMNG
jgi:hypothetical protein